MKLTKVSILLNLKAPRPKSLQRGAGRNQYEVSLEITRQNKTFEEVKVEALNLFKAMKQTEMDVIKLDPSR